MQAKQVEDELEEARNRRVARAEGWLGGLRGEGGELLEDARVILDELDRLRSATTARRQPRQVCWKGVSRTFSQWSAVTGLPPDLISLRLR